MRDPTPIGEIATPELLAKITGYPIAYVLNKLQEGRNECPSPNAPDSKSSNAMTTHANTVERAHLTPLST